MFKLVSALMVLMAAAAPSASATQCDTWLRKTKYTQSQRREVAPAKENVDKRWCVQECINHPECNAVNWEKAWKKCFLYRVDPHAVPKQGRGFHSYKICEGAPMCGSEWAPCCGGSGCDDGLTCFNGQCEPCGGTKDNDYQPCCAGDVCHSDRHNRRICRPKSDPHGDGRCAPCGAMFEFPCDTQPFCDNMLMKDRHAERPQCVMQGQD